jgi:hypothetical protein
MRADVLCVKQLSHNPNSTQEPAWILKGSKLFQATAIDKLDYSTATVVMNESTSVIFLYLPLHEARGM